MVKLDLDLAYFRWRDEYYKQLKGFGMGKSTSSPLSDCSPCQLKQHQSQRHHSVLVQKKPTIAIRNDHIQPLHDYLNSIHPDIKWTKEIEKLRNSMSTGSPPTQTNTSHFPATNLSHTNFAPSTLSLVMPRSSHPQMTSKKLNSNELRKP